MNTVYTIRHFLSLSQGRFLGWAGCEADDPQERSTVPTPAPGSLRVLWEGEGEKEKINTITSCSPGETEILTVPRHGGNMYFAVPKPKCDV